MIVDEVNLPIVNHDVARLEIAIEEEVAVALQQLVHQRLKIILQFLIVEGDAGQFYKVIFEVVEVPLHRLPIECMARISHREIQSLFACHLDKG